MICVCKYVLLLLYCYVFVLRFVAFAGCVEKIWIVECVTSFVLYYAGLGCVLCALFDSFELLCCLSPVMSVCVAHVALRWFD